jgi:DNA-directed RNA polymerase subunit alpha
VREKIIKLIGQAHDGEPKDEALELPIDSLGFSTRVRLSLLNDGIKTLGDLTKKNEVELLLIPNFGRCSLNEVKEALAQKGLFFVPRT